MTENTPYIVSARKYRPDSFEDLIGQDNIVKTLKNSIIRGKLAHAYLFCGPRGVGKTSAARIFAKTINCSNPTPEMEPCGQCESCISFQEGRSYCIHELDAASNNGVDDIKALMDQVQIPPQVGKYSVYIIDEVHMLTQSAFNAFLKTLEEPPAHAIFILATTEKHKILPTILSRCQTYDFNRIGIPDIVKNLRDIAQKEGITIDDESLHIIARKADGAMRDALTIFDQTVAFCGSEVKYEDVIRNLNVLDYEHCFSLTESMLANDYASALLKFDEILSKGFNALYFVSSMSSHFRNLMVAKSGSLDALLELPDSLKVKYKEQADKCPLQFLYDALSVTTQCESGYKESINPRLHIEFALMKLCFLTGGPVSLRPVAAAPRAGSPAQSGVAAAPVRPVSKEAAPSAASTSSGVSERSADSGVSSNAQVQSGSAVRNDVASVQSVPDGQPSVPSSAEGQVSLVSGASQVSQGVTPSAQQGSLSAVPVAQQVAGGVTPSGNVEASEAQPVRRKRTSKVASALSLDAISEAEKSGPATGGTEALGDRIPDDTEILMHWREFPKEYASRPRLSTTLATAKVEILPKDGYKQVDFFVLNVAQQKWMEEVLLKELEWKLQKALKTSRIRLMVKVVPEENVEKKIYMPEDKAKVVMAENEEVQKLVKDFDLDVK